MLKNKSEFKYICFIAVAILFCLVSIWQKVTILGDTISYKRQLYIVIIAISAIFFGISILILKNKNITETKVFLYTIPILYIAVCLVLPMSRAHDELYHWFRSYDIVQGNLLTEVNENNNAEGTFPINVRFLFKDQKSWEKIKYNDVIDSLSIDLDNDKAKIDLSTVAVYSPTQYIPQVIGIYVGKVFSNIPMIMAYIGRFFNMAFSIVMLYLALKFTPVGKKIFLSISYFPILMEGMTSFSPDAMTISVAFLFIAYVLKVAFSENKVKIRDLVILAILGVILSLCKIVYLPMILLIFIIPKEKFNSKKAKWISLICIFILCVVVNLVWLNIASKYLFTYKDGETREQVKYVLTEPIQYIKTLVYTSSENFGDYLTSMVGSSMTWGEAVSISSITIYVLLSSFIFASVFEKKISLSKFQVFIIASVIVATILLIFTSLYVQWTPYKSPIIKGVQGRYFIPIVPLIGMMCTQLFNIQKFDNEKSIKLISIIGIVTRIRCYFYINDTIYIEGMRIL